MAYSSGTANNPADLLQQLATFAAAQGWTVDRNASYSSDYWVAIHNGAAYFHFATESTGKHFLVCGATGYSSGATPGTQPGTSPQNTFSVGMTGPYTGYYFFAGSTYIFIVIEVNAGIFMCMLIGKLPAAGGITDAVFVQGVNWGVAAPAGSDFPEYAYNNFPFCVDSYATPQCIGATVDSTFRWFQEIHNGTTPARYYAPIRNIGLLTSLISRNPNTFNGLTILLPIPIFLERAIGNIYSFAGVVPGIRAINMLDINPKDEVTLGADVWKQFPACAKTATWGAGTTTKSSGPYGFAFLK